MGSVRITPQLDEKVRKVALMKGITRSAVFRKALEGYCDEELTPTSQGRYDDVIGIMDGPGDGSVRVTEYFVEGMIKKHG